MMKIRKGYSLKIIFALTGIVFLCNAALYSSPLLKDSLRVPLDNKKVLYEALYRPIEAAVKEVFQEYSNTSQADAAGEILLVEKELLADKVWSKLDMPAKDAPSEIKTFINAIIKNKFISIIAQREKTAQGYLDKARLSAKKYLASGKKDPALYNQIIENFERARHGYEVMAVAAGYEDSILLQQSNIHIEMEKFRQQAFDPDPRPDIIVSIVTSDRTNYLKTLLQSLSDELLLFPYGLGPKGETTKLKIIVIDNSVDPVSVKGNLDLIQGFAMRTSIPIYHVDISGEAFPRGYAYPLQIAGLASDSFGDPEALQCVLDDDIQIKTLVRLSNGLFGTRHVFPYFDKARIIMEDPDVLEIDGGITGNEGTTPFRMVYPATFDLLEALETFSRLQPSDLYHPNIDIRFYTDNYYLNPELSKFASKRIVPRLRVPRYNEPLTAGEQFKIYCGLLQPVLYGNSLGKTYVYHPANYTVGSRTNILLAKKPYITVGGNRWARFGASNTPFFTPPYMRRVHAARSQVINSLSGHPKSYRATLPVYHERPVSSEEIEDDAFMEVVRKGVMSMMMAGVIDYLLERTGGDDFFDRLKNVREYLEENYDEAGSPLRNELIQLEEKIWSGYGREMFADIKRILDQIDRAGYLTDRKYFWNRDPAYSTASEELKRFCAFIRTHYDPSLPFVARLEKEFRIGKGYLTDQIIRDLKNIKAGNTTQALSEVTKRMSLIKPQVIQEDKKKRDSKYWHTFNTPKGYYGDEVISALQKTIRRGDKDALLWAWEMIHADKELQDRLWERLLVISVEDVGMGNPQALQIVWELRNRYLNCPVDSLERREITLNTVGFLVESVKDRFNDEAAIHHKIYYPMVMSSPDKETLFRQALGSRNLEQALNLGITLMRSGNAPTVIRNIIEVGEQREKAVSELISVIKESSELMEGENKYLFLIHGIVSLCAEYEKEFKPMFYISNSITKISDQPVNKIRHVFLAGAQPEIKEIYLDVHTQRGKAFGRNTQHFILYGTVLDNERVDRNKHYLREIISFSSDAKNIPLLDQRLNSKASQVSL